MIGWKGCQLGESTDSFLHGVQMPVVTDDPAGAHGADVMGGRGGRRKRATLSAARERTLERVSDKYLLFGAGLLLRGKDELVRSQT